MRVKALTHLAELFRALGAGECHLSPKMPESERLCRLRDRLKDGIFSRLDRVRINVSKEHRLPNNLNLSFANTESESLLMAMKDVALSSGAACTSATVEPSHVLKALGLGDLAYSSVRFGLGRFNTEEEIDYVIGKVVETVGGYASCRLCQRVAVETIV